MCFRHGSRSRRPQQDERGPQSSPRSRGPQRRLQYGDDPGFAFRAASTGMPAWYYPIRRDDC